MVAVTLLAGVNDQPHHAGVRPLWSLMRRGRASSWTSSPQPRARGRSRRPGRAAVSAFQQVLKRRDPTLFVGVRNARGDDEMAACGQLATSTSKS